MSHPTRISQQRCEGRANAQGQGLWVRAGNLHMFKLYFQPKPCAIALMPLALLAPKFGSDVLGVLGVKIYLFWMFKCYVKLSFITKGAFCLAVKYKIINFAAK